MTVENRFEHLIEPVVGPEPNTLPLTSLDISKLPGMVVSEDEAFAEARTNAEAAYDRASLDKMVAQVTDGLTDRERRVLQLRFGLSGGLHTLKATGQEIGVSSRTVSRVQRSALEKLKRPSISRIVRALS